MTKYIIAIFVLSLHFVGFAALVSADENSPKGFSPRIIEIIEKAKSDCHLIDEGILTVLEEAITKVDLSGDGKPDEVLSHAQLECSTKPYLISTGGSLWSFVIEDHVESFVAKAWALQPRPFEDFPIPVLLLFVHGTHCDHTGVDPCVLAVIWHDSVGQFLVGKAFETIED